MMGKTTTKARTEAQRGFTLIEMSVVLVIIGLLIGGILQGQEMIKNTRIKTTVAQVDAATAAVQAFDDKFGELPGDADTAATVLGVTAGNGNGGIANAGAASYSVAATAAAAEGPFVWEHLNIAGYIQGSEDNGGWQMQAKMDGVFLEVLSVAYSATEDHLVVRMRGDFAGAPTAGLLVEDAFALDNKYDDGVPETGRYRATGGTCVTGAGDTSTYTPGETGKQCITTIEID